MFHPPPRQPHPNGGDFSDTSGQGGDNLSAVDAITLTEIQFLLPVHRIRTIATYCPPPRKGAGGGRASGRAVGVARLLAWKNVFSDTSGQGKGMFHPPPRQPLPRGRYPIDRVPGEETTSLPSTRSPSPKSRLHTLALYPDYRHALPAPYRGGGRRPRQRPGGGGGPRG